MASRRLCLDPVLLETEPTNGEQAAFATPYLRGVDPGHEADVSVLPQSIRFGKFDLSGRGLVVGSDFAETYACLSATAFRFIRRPS